MTRDLFADLQDFLGQQREMLLAGDIRGLAGLSERARALADALEESADLGGNAPAPRAVAVARAARDVQDLLAAARRGIESAALRIAEIQQAAGSLRVYGPGGTLQPCDLGTSTRELRA